MKPTTTITFGDGMRIIVPDSLNMITTYVLQEQEDWFEDEIKFLRKLVQPGHKVIDIGANYGVYTLTLAHLAGPTGYVWAFEPASATASLLRASIAVNNFRNVFIEQKALSCEKGAAQLSLNDNSELNALVHDHASDNTETVTLTTLDECYETHNWKDVDYIKLDAEGEEEKILRGGGVFLAAESPLIQYEVKAGKDLHLELVKAFDEIGYKSYRLVPGLNVLVPFEIDEPADEYLLNLFSCKSDRAAVLYKQGLLIDTQAMDKFKEDHFNEISSIDIDKLKNSWLSTLVDLPYGKICSGDWRNNLETEKNKELSIAMFLYAKSCNSSLSSTERFAALEESYLYLKTFCDSQPSHLRLSSLARIGREYGARIIAVRALSQLCNMIFERRQINPSEPFLAPGQRFDSLPPSNGIGNWIAAATLEEFERQSAFSSYYTGKSALSRLQLIRNLGFGSEEMNRRLDLIQSRFGSTVA